MANRFEMNGALKSRLLGAENAEQAADILKEAGQTVTPEDIAHLWDEISKRRKDKELSLDELEAVSGGADRDWLKDGCAATVEADSTCFATDFCAILFSLYDVVPVNGNCTQCGAAPVYNDVVRGDFFCSRCGCRMDRNGNPIQVAKQGEFPDFKF